MLHTPSTSHVSFNNVYEPAEDSFLLLDTLSGEKETAFLKKRFDLGGERNTQYPANPTSPLVIEIGTGSGVVLSFLHTHAKNIFGTRDIITAGVDLNWFACKATKETIRVAEEQQSSEALKHGFYLGNVFGDLTTSFREGQVEVLVFNPPYVPTEVVPSGQTDHLREATTFEEDSHLLELSYAGGVDGMETTNRLLHLIPSILAKDRGVAYILLCAHNKPQLVKERIQAWGDGWRVETVGESGKKGGWEKLQIIRIWR